MKIIIQLLMTVFILIAQPIQAAGEPLKVGVTSFAPPFVMQGANQKLFGFDIAMMDSLCQRINRSCQYQVIPFDELIAAVASKRVDVGISAISITLDRAQQVDFSLPYMVSYFRFIGPARLKAKPLNLGMIHNQRIGIEDGTVFDAELVTMGAKNITVVRFKHVQDIIAALQNNEVDLGLIDDPGTMFTSFWQANSGNQIVPLGAPMVYGTGLAIAVNKEEGPLLQDINKALLDFQNSGEFKENFRKYIGN